MQSVNVPQSSAAKRFRWSIMRVSGMRQDCQSRRRWESSLALAEHGQPSALAVFFRQAESNASSMSEILAVAARESQHRAVDRPEKLLGSGAVWLVGGQALPKRSACYAPGPGLENPDRGRRRGRALALSASTCTPHHDSVPSLLSLNSQLHEHMPHLPSEKSVP